MTQCACPRSIPDWNGRDINLGGQCALLLPFPTFLNMPIGYEIYAQRQQHLIKQLELKEPWPDFVLVHTGAFRGQLLRLIEETESASRHITHLPRPFNVRVLIHHGGIGTIKSSIRKSQMELLDSGKMPKQLYLGYLTCPVCEEERGGAKIMVVRRWEESPTLVKRLKR